MSALIKNLHIKNFKSVRDLSLDCDRINIFIGKPNAGKSNILEAISLLGVSYLNDRASNKFLETIVRYKSLIHLFNNFNFRTPIEINADNEITATLAEANKVDYNYDFSISSSLPTIEDNKKKRFADTMPSLEMKIFSDGRLHGSDTKDANPRPSPVKRYEFHGLLESTKNGFNLQPPHGDNFYSIVEGYPELRSEIQDFLRPNGLELLLDIESQRITIMQKQEDSFISFPLQLVPDTFQRYIFYLAAIMSNQDSVLLFEEPESHSYPPYIYQLAQKIIQDEQNNQYFLTTHNPYLLTPILEETKDVALFVTWFEDYQTHARRLSEDEIREVLNDGLDVFLNLKHFVPA